MVEKHSTYQGRLSRRSWLLGAGTLAILSGTVGCLGLGDDDKEAGEPENGTDGNGSEDTSTEPDGERNETTDTESNDTGPDDAEGSEPEADDSSILEEEPNDNESDDSDENDSEGNQADLDNESDDNETQKNDTAEESQKNLDNGSNDNGSNDNSSNESSDGDENDSESNQDESEEKEREFEQIIIEELSYQVDYPADWEMVETDESIPVVIANSDETAWIWIDIRETSLDLEGDITNYRQNFEPHPDFEIHEDEPMTLSSGEDGHRFVIEVTENPGNPLIAHELLANENGNEYMTSVQVSRPEYDEDYAELAEEILASVDLS